VVAKRKYFIIGILVVSLILVRYVFLEDGKSVIKAAYPLEKIKIEKSVIKIFISNEASLNEVVNLEIFKSINPNMTKEEIIKHLGQPKDLTIRYDSKFLVYYTDNGRIESGASGGVLNDDSPYHSDICMFFKENFTKEFLFRPTVARYLPDKISDLQIGIFVKKECDFVIDLSSKKEDWIQWTNRN
jgi:hypothetical protein